MGKAAQLTRTLVARDPDGAGHALRVTALALRLAEAVGAGPQRVEAIRSGGPLHDIGKLAVDPAILRKPGALEPDELAEIQTHPIVGTRMLAGIRSLRSALDCVLYHHERWDGAGYPHRLGGHEIPFEARILAVADAYDAMTSDRPYRPAMTRDEAVVEVERCSGTQFDPELAKAFLAL
ncbi:MAG TPA: HD-GYP domain-containing protein [Gaiellaceae bacterium]|nr:HD-GYP domain-containing protein [Gaiellaceae bacterium]